MITINEKHSQTRNEKEYYEQKIPSEKENIKEIENNIKKEEKFYNKRYINKLVCSIRSALKINAMPYKTNCNYLLYSCMLLALSLIIPILISIIFYQSAFSLKFFYTSKNIVVSYIFITFYIIITCFFSYSLKNLSEKKHFFYFSSIILHPKPIILFMFSVFLLKILITNIGYMLFCIIIFFAIYHFSFVIETYKSLCESNKQKFSLFKFKRFFLLSIILFTTYSIAILTLIYSLQYNNK